MNKDYIEIKIKEPEEDKLTLIGWLDFLFIITSVLVLVLDVVLLVDLLGFINMKFNYISVFSILTLFYIQGKLVKNRGK